MNLRRTVLAIVILGFSLLTLSLFFIVQGVVMDKFSSLEELEVIRNVNRAINGLNDRKSKLDALAKDWVWRNAMYELVQSSHREFKEASLVSSLFSSGQLFLFGVYDTQGNLIVGNTWQDDSLQPVPEVLSHKIFFGIRELGKGQRS